MTNTSTGFAVAANNSRAGGGIEASTASISLPAVNCSSGYASSQGQGGAGVDGESIDGPALIGHASGSGAGLVASNTTGEPQAPGDGIDAGSTYGTAIKATGQGGIAMWAQAPSGGDPAWVALYAQRDTNEGYPVITASSENKTTFNLDDRGNVTISGNLYTSGLCKSGCSRTHGIASYGARSAGASIDDVGEAPLHDGSAHVALDPAFANVIDTNRPYVVLLTPEGDAALYVAARDANGFTVRKMGGGHASIPFAYRIVATPYGAEGDRLPAVDLGTARPAGRKR